MAATVALRVAIFPLVLMQMRNTGRMTAAKPELERLAARQKTMVGLGLGLSPKTRRGRHQPGLDSRQIAWAA